MRKYPIIYIDISKIYRASISNAHVSAFILLHDEVSQSPDSVKNQEQSDRSGKD